MFQAQTMLKSPEKLLALFRAELPLLRESGSLFKVLCTFNGCHAESESCGNAVIEVNQLEAVRPTKPLSTLVVMDSSFNPPTLAHLAMCRSALERNSSDRRLLLLYAVSNADKAPRPEPAEHRLAMMYAFAQDLLESPLKQHENESDSFSNQITVDIGVTTQPLFSDKAPAIINCGFFSTDHGHPELVFLVGWDTLVRIFSPKYHQDAPDTPQDLTPMQAALDPFFSTSRLRVTSRPYDAAAGLEEQRRYLERLAQTELEAVGGRSSWAKAVELVEASEAERLVSSTLARQACAAADEAWLSQLVSSSVGHWIKDHQLYGWSTHY